MRKALRKPILLLLAAVIIAAVPQYALAQPASQEESMETALIAVRTLVDIDDDIYTEFNYSSTFSNWETREGLIWYFSWSSSMDSNHMSAQVTADGVLLGLWKYNWEERYVGFAQVGKAEAVAAADDFIKRANPQTHTYYKAPADVSININSRDYSLTYIAEVNGHLFNAARISVSVNKFTGEVTSYRAGSFNPSGYSFESAADIITENAAIAAYAEKIGLTLEYRSYFDYENRAINVFPAYLLNSQGDRFISAKSGDVVNYIYDRGRDGSSDYLTVSEDDELATEGAGVGNAPRLSQAEIEAIEKVAGLLTQEQALSRLFEDAELKNMSLNSFDDQSIRLSQNYMEQDRYFYDINLYNYEVMDDADEISGIYGRVDAKTGRVLSFSIWYSNRFDEPLPRAVNEAGGLSEAQVASNVESFLRRLAPAEFAKSVIDNARNAWDGNSSSFSYTRHENNTPFRDNGIRVTYDHNRGRVTNYSLNWYETVSFPGISAVITPQNALTVYAAQTGSSISYITIGDGVAALVYDFSSEGMIDPFNGKAIDYTGEPWIDNTIRPDYSDVRGHWAESIVMRLHDNGVYGWSGRFRPDQVMTELEFLQYLMLAEGNNRHISPAAFFSQRGVNVDASPSRQLTRQEAARIIVEYLGYGEIARHPQWYVYPYRDSVVEEYKGFITICHMLGIVTGSNGVFNASSNITRAHAAVMLHNVISLKS